MTKNYFSGKNARNFSKIHLRTCESILYPEHIVAPPHDNIRYSTKLIFFRLFYHHSDFFRQNIENLNNLNYGKHRVDQIINFSHQIITKHPNVENIRSTLLYELFTIGNQNFQGKQIFKHYFKYADNFISSPPQVRRHMQI